jgi:phage tail sheath protein FI
MPEYLAPGVYVEEVDTGNKPIEGVSTSTVGFIGIAERGPVAPTFLGSFSEYAQTFGGYVSGAYLTHAVEGFFLNGGKRCFVVRVAGTGATAATSTDASLGGLHVDAAGPGVWANGRLAVKVSAPGLTNPNAPAGSATVFKLSVFYWGPTVSEPNGGFIDPSDPANLSKPEYRAPTLTEVYDNLSTDPNSSSYYVGVVNNGSNLVAVRSTASTPPTVPTALLALGNGSDGAAVVATDFTGDPTAEPGQKRALAAFEEIDEISLLCCPDAYTLAAADATTVLEGLVAQCENLRYRFAIIDAPSAAPKLQNHFPFPVSKYAGYYYPWITILDPISQNPLIIPPSGHMAGIYAQTDNDRGVHKAPANVVINGLYLDPANPSSGLQLQVTKAQQEILNPRGVNALRYFPGRGNLVWGARTTTTDPDWKYINVRRLFIFVEKSIDEGTQWVVFEGNYEPTWARVRRSVSDFLTRVWMDGMLQGVTKEQAFFVRCDRTTMTQADIDNGRLIVLVGIAPVKPAEFVIFRIGQWTGGSDVAEG